MIPDNGFDTFRKICRLIYMLLSSPRLLQINYSDHHIFQSISITVYEYVLKSMTPPTSDHLSEKKESPECRKCIDNLLSALRSPSSKQRALLHAMGAQNKGKVDNKRNVSLSTNKLKLDNSDLIVERNGPGLHFMIPKQNYSSEENSSSAAFPFTDSNSGLTTRIIGQEEKMGTGMKGMIGKVPSKPSKPSIPPTIATIDNSNNDRYISLNIFCKKCGNTGPEGSARAFVYGPSPLSIVLCSNRLSSEKEIQEVLVHELYHVYDLHNRLWDLTNCRTLAKSEVRAAREAECANSRFNLTKKICVWETAKLSTMNMFPQEGKECLLHVFEEAMKDMTPFSKGSRDSADINEVVKENITTNKFKYYADSFKTSDSER